MRDFVLGNHFSLKLIPNVSNEGIICCSVVKRSNLSLFARIIYFVRKVKYLAASGVGQIHAVQCFSRRASNFVPQLRTAQTPRYAGAGKIQLFALQRRERQTRAKSSLNNRLATSVAIRTFTQPNRCRCRICNVVNNTRHSAPAQCIVPAHGPARDTYAFVFRVTMLH